jgi:multidrug efflux pump
MFKTLFYDNRQLLTLSLVVIFVAGFSALMALPRLEDPRINNRNPVIVTLLPGASAERVESLVTKKLEEELREVSEIRQIESDSRANVSLITIELSDDVDDTDEVFARLRDKLSDVQSELPPQATRPDFDDERGAVAYTLILGITWDAATDPALGILSRTADELADRLRNLSGTDLVRVYGVPEEEITVTLARDKVAQLGLSIPQIQARILAADSKVPAGTLRSAEKNVVMEVRGGFTSIDRIARIPLRENASGEILQLSDVATVEKSWRDPPAEIGLVDGRRGVYVAARMVDDQRVDVWMERAKSVVADFRQSLSPTVKVVEVFDQGKYTNQRLGQLGWNLVLGAGAVVLVIFVMMGWRASILVGLALPLVSAMVLFALLVLGIPLHQMSIFGLIVALGLLIDNAIVVVDEVGSQLRAGASPREAIAKTVRHLFVPLLGSTLTTVIAFLPIFLLPGSVGEFVGTIATTVILALIFSLFVSMTIIPALAGRFGRFRLQTAWWRTGIETPRLAALLRHSIQLAVRRPVLGVLFAMVLPMVGFFRAGELRNQFFPGADRDQFHIQVWLPRDAAADLTRRTAQEMEATIRESAGIESVNWLVGASIPTVYYNMIMDQDQKPSYAQAVVTASSAARGKALITELQARLDERFPQAQTIVKQLGQGPPIDAPVEIRVYGPSVERLRMIGQDLQRVLFETPQVVHTRTSLDVIEPKLWVEADEVESRLGGLTLAEIALQLQTTLEGAIGGSVLEQTEELPVRMRLDNRLRGDLDEIAVSRIVLPDGERWTPLSALGELSLQPQVPSIQRRNGERCNTIKAYVHVDALAPEVTSAFLARLEASGFQPPSGYRLEIGGDTEEMNLAMRQLFQYAPVLAVMMLATVVLTFRSFLLAGILGAVALLSAGLAFFNLWFAGYPLGFNPMIGTAGLIGIALNDSIVVLAQIRTNSRARNGDVDAIAGEVMKTIRHVLSTTLTTIAGFLPLLLSGGDFWPPLAIVIAGGVGGASLLALYFVPASYAILRRFVERSAVPGVAIAMPRVESTVAAPQLRRPAPSTEYAVNHGS